MTDYLELARQIVNRAHDTGLEAEAYITRETETTISVSQGQVEQFAQSGSQGLGLRIFDQGRMGYAYTSDLSAASIDTTWNMAVELAGIATADEYRRLPDPQPINAEDLEIWDKDLASVTPEQKIEKILAVEQAALDYDPRVFLTNRCTYQDAIEQVYLANSRGFTGSYGRTIVFSYLFAFARDENGSASALGVNATNFFSDLDAQATGAQAARRAVQILNGKQVDTQVASVVLDPIVAGQILGTIGAALTAEAMQRGRSFLLNKMGQEVGSDKVTLLANGRMKRGLASAPFDGEGVPTSAVRLIDEGIFQNVIYDTYTARKDGVQSTGHAQRGSHRDLPRLGMNNFYIQPGPATREEIIAGVQNGLYVTNIMQTGGIDPITGDCSMGASGVWIRDGQLTDPINGVTIATTLPDLLKNIVEVGSDLTVLPFGGAVGAPTLRVDNVTIGGNG